MSNQAVVTWKLTPTGMEVVRLALIHAREHVRHDYDNGQTSVPEILSLFDSALTARSTLDRLIQELK